MKKINILIFVLCLAVIPSWGQLIIKQIEAPSIQLVELKNPSDCGKSDALISVSGATSFAWNNGKTTALNSNIQAGNYSVTVSDKYGCSSSATYIINDPNQIQITSQPTDITVCAGESFSTLLTATGSSNLSYQWIKVGGSVVSSTANWTVNSSSISQSGQYYCVVKSGSCQVLSNTVNVTVNPIPYVEAGTNQTINWGNMVAIGMGSQSSNISYAWSPANGLTDPNVSYPSANPATTTTYKVTATNNNTGCSAMDSVIISVVGGPLIASATTTSSVVCPGGQTSLSCQVSNGSGNYTYLWSPATGLSNPQIANPIATPTATTTYSVLVSDGNKTANASVVITVSNPPVANAGADKTITVGNSTVIGSTSGEVYSWSSSPLGFISTVSNPTVNPTTTTTYTITVSNAFFCTATDDVIVKVVGYPLEITPVASSNGNVISLGTSTQLSVGVQGGATGNYTYLWSPATGLSNIHIANPIVSPTITTTYTVTVSDGAEALTASYVVIVKSALPTAQIVGGNKTICNGETTSLTINLTGIQPWRVKLSDGSVYDVNQTPFTVQVSPTTTTIYSVDSVVDLAGSGYCLGYSEVKVNPIPQVDLGIDREICLEKKITLSNQIQNSSNLNYQWSTGATASSISPEIISTTTYTVTVTNTFGCTATDDVIVKANPLPVLTVNKTVFTICKGQSDTIKVSGADSYIWNGEILPDNMIIKDTTNKTYNIIGSSNGCSKSIKVNVIVNPLPIAYAGNDTVICQGSSINITATGSNLYSWSNGINQSSMIVSPTSTNNYTVTVTDINNCSATDDVVVTVSPLPTVDAGPDFAICSGSINQMNIASTGATSFAWSGQGLSDKSVANPTIKVDANMTSVLSYIVVVANQYGCKATDEVLVTVSPLPSISVNKTWYACQAQDLQLTASSSIAGSSWKWNGQGLSDPNVANPVANLQESTSYFLVVTSPQGCSSTTLVNVEVTKLPISDFTYTVDSDNKVNFINQSSNAYSYEWNFGDGNSSTEFSPSRYYGANGNFNVWLTASNSCGSSSTNHLINGVLASIEDANTINNNISIFPNPTTDYINLTGVERKSTITVTNSIGQILYSKEDSNIIDVRSFPKGIYYISITKEGVPSIVKKIIKQ